jgi:site-specific recombinase XerD
LVFCAPDGSPWSPAAFSSAFVHVAAKAGQRGFRLHDLRHAFASIVLKAGTNVKEVQGLLGRSSAKLTLDTYAHLMERQGREAVRRLGRALADDADRSQPRP